MGATYSVSIILVFTLKLQHSYLIHKIVKLINTLMFITDSIKTLEHLTSFSLLLFFMNIFILFFLCSFRRHYYYYFSNQIHILEDMFTIVSFLCSWKKTCLRTDAGHKHWQCRADVETRLTVSKTQGDI